MSKLYPPKYKVGDLVYAEVSRHKRKYAGTILAIKYYWSESEYGSDGWWYKVPKDSYIDYISEEEIVELIATQPLKGDDK